MFKTKIVSRTYVVPVVGAPRTEWRLNTAFREDFYTWSLVQNPTGGTGLKETPHQVRLYCNPWPRRGRNGATCLLNPRASAVLAQNVYGDAVFKLTDGLPRHCLLACPSQRGAPAMQDTFDEAEAYIAMFDLQADFAAQADGHGLWIVQLQRDSRLRVQHRLMLHMKFRG